MAGKKPSFITGANAKIQVGGKTFAYCSDVAYTVSVDTIPIETMGRYEAVTNEPVNYSVSGSLSVVRYTKVAKANGMPSTAEGGNGLGKVDMGTTTGGIASDHINPGNILFSQTWDLAVYQKQETSAASATAAGLVSTTEFINITDCRFTRKSAQLTKRGILVDRLDFVGVLADDDSFTVSGSGDIDLA
jgi:membrane protease subunit (stomatin/prohibitin family)